MMSGSQTLNRVSALSVRSKDTVDTVDQSVMNRRAYYNRLQNAEICLERFNIFLPIQTSDQKLILEPIRSKGLSV